MSNNNKLVIPVKDTAVQEIVIAWLSILEVDAIVEDEHHIEAYLESGNYNKIIKTLAERTSIAATDMRVVEVEDRNWNEEWEANFKPIEIGDIYIRAPFHEASVKHPIDLVISPKMAFGTGHHATTYMMLDYMLRMDLKGKNVLDYGCGTGILTVFAKMRACRNIVGIDIQKEAIENTYEHFELNGIETEELKVALGDLDVLNDTKYDVILANINRHVLLKNGTEIRKSLAEDGLLIMSGILRTDRELILRTYKALGFQLIDETQKGEWCRFGFRI